MCVGAVYNGIIKINWCVCAILYQTSAVGVTFDGGDCPMSVRRRLDGTDLVGLA